MACCNIEWVRTACIEAKSCEIQGIDNPVSGMIGSSGPYFVAGSKKSHYHCCHAVVIVHAPLGRKISEVGGTKFWMTVPTTGLAIPVQSLVLEKLLYDALTSGEQRVKS